MASKHLDNPAGRLLEIIRAAQAASTRKGGRPTFEVWADVFGIEPSSREAEAEILNRILEVDRLISKLEEELQTIEDDEDRESFLQPIPRFRTIVLISEARAIPFSNQIQAISAGDLVVLEFCSRALHKMRPEVRADDTLLEELRTDVLALFDTVKRSDTIDPELRVFLLDQLNRITQGIQEYSIGGIEKLRTSLGAVFGASLVNQEVIFREREKGSDELEQFIEVTTKLTAIIQFAWKTTKLLNAVGAVFPHLLSKG